jgi:hypothetical protein
VKKKKADESSPGLALNGSASIRDARLKTAIERVFRLTHNREMTAEERRNFGINGSSSNHKRKLNRGGVRSRD